MGYKTFDQAIKEYPTAIVNSSREILRSWRRKYEWSKSGFWARKLERAMGIDIDQTDKDHGEPPVTEIYEMWDEEEKRHDDEKKY